MKSRLIFAVLGVVFFTTQLFAQDGANQINYSSLAQQIVQTNLNGDPHASILPSVAIDNGYGSFLDNPASMALINDTYFTMGYLSNQAENTNSFKNVSSTIDGQLGRFSNLGLIYSAPTTQGSIVIGGGYTINNSINRKNLLSAENTTSTITDVFTDANSTYNDIAFETFAIDYADVEQTQLESIFRIGFEPGTFPGIFQDVEITQRSSIGELSLFGATEFRKNLFFGVSLALVSGTHNYSRDFLERDLDNVYDGDFLFQDEEGLNGTDIDAVLLRDEIESEVLGSSVRAGLVYKVTPFLNVGASYAIPNKYFITENYYSLIRTTFDDASISEDDFDGDFTYEIRRPGQLNLGLAIVDVAGFSASGSIELIDYRNTEVILTSDPDLSFEDISVLRDEEDLIKQNVNQDYNNVLNIKVGAKYQTDNGFELRTGFSSLPGRSNRFSADRSILSGGIGIPLSNDIYLDVTTQYSQWDDRSIIYEYFDDVAGQVRSESISESISQVNVLVGLTFRF
jgi:long-subunit fatty acid transport protein